MTIVKMPVALIVTFVWVGFVCAISFMEAWIKFRAPGVTMPIGLGIGRLVFNLLNKIEWVFAVSIVVNILLSKASIVSFQNLLYLVPLIILFAQTTWLLPSLDARAELYIQNQTVPPSDLHFYYVGMEAIKVICLGVFGISLFKSFTI